MRPLQLCVCGLLLFVATARAQVAWNFDQTTPTGAPTTMPATITGGTLTATNASVAFNNTSSSTTAPSYAGASGNNNASVTAVTTAFSTSTSTFFTCTLNAGAGVRLLATGIKFGTRSTGSGPTLLALYSSADNFTTELGHIAVNADSNWAFVTLPSFLITSAVNGSLTFRLYGSGGTGTAGAGNWRIDDLVITVVTIPPGPTITAPPVDTNVSVGQPAGLSVAATGSGTLTYQWRKNGVAINPTANPSAATTTLTLASASASDVGSYDVVVTDSAGSLTSSAAALTVGTSIVLNESTLTAVFDGTPHAVAVTVAPATLTYTVAYNNQINNPPINAGSYAVVATITTPGVTGSASGTLVVAQTAQTITFNMNPGFAPAVAVPFTANATASGSTTVRFAVASGNATASGTNNATITATDTSAFTIQASTTGDANNAPVSPGPTLAVAAAAPAALSGTYIQNFDALGTAMPAGWHVFTGATASSLGTEVSGVTSSLVLTPTDWGSTTGNFRNVASALNGGVSAADSVSTQALYSNRALGVRQNSSLDPGAALAFNFKTTGVNVVSVSFSAQIVSAQANATTWLLQSATGQSPTSWTTLATFNDPGAFGATTISATASNFGTALNNQNTAWLRVVALSATTFGGTRDTFAIDNFTVVTGPVLAIGTAPTAQTLTSGQALNLSVGATGTGALTYQWRKNGTAIIGATNATFSLASALTTDAGSYDVIVADTVGQTTANAAAVTVAPAPTTIALSNLTATYDGTPHAATATPTPAGATIALTYTGVGLSPSPASTTPPTNPGTYLVSATTTDAEHAGSTSALLVISGAAGATAPTVVTAPASQSVGYGATVTFTVDVSGSPTPVLQWRKDGVALAGATNASYTIYGVANADAGVYDVVLANAGGTTVSPAATLTVAQNPQTITFAAPTAASPAGTNVKLAAAASSGLPVVFSIVSGAGTISGSTLIGRSTEVVIRASQPGNTAYAAATPVDQKFQFVVAGTTPFFIAPPLDQTVNVGATLTLTGTALGTPVPTYQWSKDSTPIAGATNSSLALSSVGFADAGRYTVTATNSSGTATVGATLVVRGAPAIISAPVDRTVNAGDTVTLTLVAAGFPTPAIQWRKNGTAIAGATNATLTLANVSPADAGKYDALLANPFGSITTTAGTVTVNVRDFSGEYFGRFRAPDGTTILGDFAVHVRTDGTAVLAGYIPGLSAAAAASLKVDLVGIGFGVTTTLKLDRAGGFSVTLPVLAATPGTTQATTAVPTAAAPRTLTLTGTTDEIGGTLQGAIPELGLTATADRSPAAGPAAAYAGLYTGGIEGTSAGQSVVIAGADGRAFVYMSVPNAAVGLTTTVAGNGAISVPNNSATLPGSLGFRSLDLSLAGGTAAGSVTLDPPSIWPISSAKIIGAADAVAGTQHLANVSVRGITAPGLAPLIVGFVTTGSAPKQVLVRAAGPAIAGAPFNLAGAITDPAIQLYRGAAAIAANDNWGTPAANGTAIAAAAARVGAFAFRNASADSALLTTVTPGAYTLVVDDRTGTSGLTLAEVYEVPDAAETPGSRRLVNLSARAAVIPGEPLLAGFVIAGAAPQRVLIRGIGPALAAAPFNIAGALANPQVTLRRGNTTLATNDDWYRSADATLIRDTAVKLGAFPLGPQSADAALLVYLSPGAYTVELAGPANASTAAGTGLALIEIYDALP